MTRRPPEPRLRKAKSRMAPGGRLRSESPVRPPLPRVMSMNVPQPHGLRWADYPPGYTWADHPTGVTWADLHTLDDLGVTP